MRQFVVFALFAIFASSFAAESQPAAPAAPAAVSSSHSLYDNMKAIPQLSKTMAIIDLPELSIVKNLLKGTEAVKANETKSGEKMHTAEALPLWSLFAAADAPKNKTLPTHEGIKAPFRTAKAPFTLFAPNNDAWDRFVAVHAAAKQKKATVLKGNETGAATTTNTTSSSSSQASATGASTTSDSQAEQKQEGGQQQQQQQQQQGGTEQWSAEDKKLLIAALQYHIVNSVNLSLASLANEGDNFKLFMPTLLNNADFVLLNGESQVLVLEKMGGKFMLFDGFAANQTQPIKSNVTASQQQQQQAGGASNATTSGAGSQAAVSEPAGSNATSRGTSKVLEGTSLTISRIMNAPAADLSKLAPSLAAIEYANIVQQDVVSSNGVLQVIDKILLVPTTLSSNLEHARLNKLFKVLNDWKFIEKLDNMTDVTVFAPADEALASLPDISEKDREKYIMAHVVQGARYTSNFTSGQQQQQQQQSSTTAEQTQTQTQASSLKSLANSTISVSEADKKLFFNKDSSNAQLLIGDIILKNGVMHIISKPLFATNQTAQR